MADPMAKWEKKWKNEKIELNEKELFTEPVKKYLLIRSDQPLEIE